MTDQNKTVVDDEWQPSEGFWGTLWMIILVFLRWALPGIVADFWDFFHEPVNLRQRYEMIGARILSFLLLLLLGVTVLNVTLAQNWIDMGKQQGFTTGYSLGYTAGQKSGYTKGQSDGYNSGYTDGQKAGYQNGKNDGYANGYQDGRNDGLKNGISQGQFEALDSECHILKDNEPTNRVLPTGTKFVLVWDKDPANICIGFQKGVNGHQVFSYGVPLLIPIERIPVGQNGAYIMDRLQGKVQFYSNLHDANVDACKFGLVGTLNFVANAMLTCPVP